MVTVDRTIKRLHYGDNTNSKMKTDVNLGVKPSPDLFSEDDLETTMTNLSQSATVTDTKEPAFEPSVRYLPRDGELVEYADAKLHVLSTTLKYGVGVFEGFRAYWSDEDQQLYAFRVADHMRRLIDSMRVVEIDGPRDIAREMRMNAAAEGLRAPVQVMQGNFNLMSGTCAWWDGVKG